MTAEGQSVVAQLGNVTPARRQALHKLATWRECWIGLGMYDEKMAVVSPAGADWLVRHGLADRNEHRVTVTPKGILAWMQL